AWTDVGAGDRDRAWHAWSVIRLTAVLATGPTVVVHVSGAGWPTLVLAVVGVVLSLLALAWQAYSFTRSGSRMKVELKRGLRSQGAVVTFPANPPTCHVDEARTQGFTEPVSACRSAMADRSASRNRIRPYRFDSTANMSSPGTSMLDRRRRMPRRRPSRRRRRI